MEFFACMVAGEMTSLYLWHDNLCAFNFPKLLPNDLSQNDISVQRWTAFYIPPLLPESWLIFFSISCVSPSLVFLIYFFKILQKCFIIFMPFLLLSLHSLCPLQSILNRRVLLCFIKQLCLTCVVSLKLKWKKQFCFEGLLWSWATNVKT